MLGWFKKKKTADKIDEKQNEKEKGTTEEEAAPQVKKPRGTGIFGSVESEEIQYDKDEPAPGDAKPPAEKAAPDQERISDGQAKETEPAAELKQAVPPQEIETEEKEDTKPEATSLFKRLSSKLTRTRDTIVLQMDNLFLGKKEIDAELLDDLEELLITADIGVNTATELLDYARKKVKRKELSDPASLKKFIKEKLRTFIADSSKPAELVMPDSGPFVIMVVGVNGVGKTTTIGKIAHKFINSGQSVLLAAADTFRAAAVSQLKIWGQRNGVEVVCKGEGADPSSVAFDAMTRAVEENYDVLLVDTAGRLHTQTNLMEELKKIKRVMAKKIENAPHEVLLVIDATTGQNGISQAKLFDQAVGVSGLALTKLDGTAKGGIVANISRDMSIPIRFIGIGEKMEDLRDFDPDEFIEALFGENITDQ